MHWKARPVAIIVLGVQCLIRAAIGADFNADGRQDLVWRDHLGRAVLWQMEGLAPASRSTLYPALDAGSAIVGTGTFSGSGGAIAWLDSTDRLSLWQVSVNALAQACIVASDIDPSWSFLGIGDLDRDGIDDFAWRLPDGSVEVYYMNGCTIAQVAALGQLADPTWKFAGIGSVDAQHGAMFWRDAAGNVVLWRLRSSGGVASSTLTAGALASWSIAAIADFDGDGKSDVLWRDPAGAQAAVWLMNGTSTTAQAVVAAAPRAFSTPDMIFLGDFDARVEPAPPLSADWTVVAATDTDGDGRADVVLADAHGDVAVWKMQGGSIMATGLSPAAADMPYSGANGWRMPLDRPTITKLDGTVTVDWTALRGATHFTVYASTLNDPSLSGVAIGVAQDPLVFARDDAGFSDKRYFAVGADYLGIHLPTSPEAYLVEFTPHTVAQWGAMAIADINRDGCMDILGAYGDCAGNLQPFAPSAVGLGALTASGRANRDVRFADFNGDGILDVVSDVYTCDVAACGGNDTNSQIELFFGNGDGTFTEDSSFAQLSLPGGGYGETIAVADFNNDGYLDIFIPKYTFYDAAEHDFLLINDGGGHFVEAADAAGVAMRDVPLCGRPEGAQAVDLNGNGRIDLYAASHLFLNIGAGSGGIPDFQDLGPVIDSHCDVLTASPAGLPEFFDEGAKFIDLDNSGRLALALNGETSARGIEILQFDGVAHFSEIENLSNVFFSDAWGFNAADVDGDGRTDLVVAGGCAESSPGSGEADPSCSTYALPHLLVNRSGQFVAHDFYADGLDPSQRGWNDLVSFADFDRSGTPDFVARLDGGADYGFTLLVNDAVDLDALTVSVVGPHGEQNQEGRVVRVSPVARPEITMTQVVDGGSGYMANAPYDLTFAAPYPGAYAVSVRFANATYTTTVHAGDHVTMRSDGTYSLN